MSKGWLVVIGAALGCESDAHWLASCNARMIPMARNSGDSIAVALGCQQQLRLEQIATMQAAQLGATIGAGAGRVR